MDKPKPEVVRQEKAKEPPNKALPKDTKTLREFDTQSISPVKEYNPEQIRQIRVQTNTSQAVFAVYLNTSPSTIWRWENGKIKPKGTSLKLLNLVERKGIDIFT